MELPIQLPPTWFEARITLEQIRSCFSTGREEIRIACGFFTLKGWGLIKRYTSGKRVYLLVGIDEPGEDRARAALVKEIMQHLATGLDEGRKQSVDDLVERMRRRTLSIVDARASSHHGKLYIVDRHTAINTSANTTGRGFLDQKESGGLYAPSVIDRFVEEYSSKPGISITPAIVEALREFVESQVANFIASFDQYFYDAYDITEELLKALSEWLLFASPWDIYLKTILAFEQIKTIKTTYTKQPVSYQRDMIAQALRQIRNYGGSILVASTGLGKTVMGTHIAIQLHAEDLIDKVIVICPTAVLRSWKREMRQASLYMEPFNIHVLDMEDSTRAHALDEWESIFEDVTSGNGRYLLIVDECHQLRKRYPDEFINRRYRAENRRERKAFTRINQLVNQFGNSNVKVLLLSGSPYATDIDNLNTQLFLLPHTAPSETLFPDLFGENTAWQIQSAEDFIKLPIVHRLTTPHVAKYYAEQDESGRYLKFGEQKLYFPNVTLHSLYFSLIFEDELGTLIQEGYLDLNTNHPFYRKNIANQTKVAWASSPLALCEMLEQVVDTPGGVNEFDFAERGKSEFVTSPVERQNAFNPLIENLKKLSYNSDPKFKILLQILEWHCPSEKVIVFCERHSTAYYLKKALAKLKPSLRVFSTVVQSQPQRNKAIAQYKLKRTHDIEEAIAKFAPIANNAPYDPNDTYDVFIATDAFGIGVNMQDASITVNYDIAWTAIEPTQRAGRTLRPWHEVRTIQIYTLVPTLSQQSELKGELRKIYDRWENLMDRHQVMRQLVDLPVLTSRTRQEVNMPDFAGSQIVMESAELKLEDEQWVSSYYQHASKLHPYREYARNLKSDLVSALTYPERTTLVYVLIKHRDEYIALLYEPKTQSLRSPSPEYILDLIRCTPDSETAWVDREVVETLADTCLALWCQQEGINPEDIVRECTLYLKPQTEVDDPASWLHPKGDRRFRVISGRSGISRQNALERLPNSEDRD